MDHLTTTQRRVIAEEQDDGTWLVMWDDGRVDWFRTQSAVLNAVKKTAKADIDIAIIEWRFR